MASYEERKKKLLEDKGVTVTSTAKPAQTTTAEVPSSDYEARKQKLLEDKGISAGTVQTQTVKNSIQANTADRKANAQGILNTISAGIKAGAQKTAQTDTGRKTYKYYQNAIEEAKQVGDRKKARQLKDEYTQFKTDEYYRKRNRQKENMYSQAAADPDYSAYVAKGQKIYDLMKADANKPRFGITVNTGANMGDAMGQAFETQFKLGNFTEDEKNTYLYLLGKNGWDSADEYEKLLERDINERKAEKAYEFDKNFAKENKAAAVGLNAVGSYFGGAGLIDSYRQAFQNAGRSDEDYVPPDPNTGAFGAVNMQKALTEGLTEDIKTPFGKFLAETGLSTVNFLAGLAAGGGNVSLGIMGSNAGGTAAYDAMKRGATPEQAAVMGTIAAVAEMAFERIPVGHATDLFTGNLKETFKKAMIKMAGEEGLEELCTEYVNLLGDHVVMGNKSEMNQYIRELKAGGLSDEEAQKKAVFEFAIKQPGMAFLGGALSGAGIGMAGGGAGRMSSGAIIDTIAETVAEEQGITKEEAKAVVIETLERMEAEEETASEEEQNVPEENADEYFGPEEPRETDNSGFFDMDEQAEEAPAEDQGTNIESGIAPFMFKLAEELKNETGMSDEEARAAVREAMPETGENLTETGEERIWERAAREQAEYDAEYERTHPQTAEENLTEEVPAEEEIQPKTREERLAEYEAAEKERQNGIIRNTVIQNTVGKFTEAYPRYSRLAADVENWITQEIDEKGIPEAFADDLNQYSEYKLWDLTQRAKQYFPQVRGYDIEGRMRTALQMALNDIQNDTTTYTNRIQDLSERPAERTDIKQQLKENPETAEAFISENYGKNIDGLWGNEIRTDSGRRNANTEAGQSAEGAKRNYQETEKKVRSERRTNITKPEQDMLNDLSRALRNVRGIQDENIRANIINNVAEQVRRGEAIELPNGHRIPPYLGANREIVAELLNDMVEWDVRDTDYSQRAGDLKAAQAALATQAAPALDGAEDLKTPASYYVLSPKRVFERIFKNMPATGDWFVQHYANPISANEADSTRMKNEVYDAVRDLGIKTNNKNLYHLEFYNKDGTPIIGDFNESGVLQIYGEGLIDDAELNELTDQKGKNIDADKIRHARDVISTEYKRLLDSINAVLVEYGYTPSMEIKNYFPHYNEGDLNFWERMAQAAGFDASSMDIPTNIAGRTGTFKPGKQYFGNILRRTADTTTYDAIGGFQKYVDVAGNIIYHTSDIQRLRALGYALRERYGQDTLNTQLRDIKESRIRGKMGTEEYYDQKNDIEDSRDQNLTKMTNLVKWIDEEANLLAGKQSFLDRAMENLLGRKSLRWAKNLMQNFSQNVIGGNVSSAVTNFIPLFQDDTNAKYKLKALKDIIQNGLNVDDMIDRSDFLTNRYGVKPLVMTPMQNIAQKGYFLMEAIDHLTARTLVRARYEQNIAAGMSEDQALAEADDHVARVMVDRSRGSMPTLFNVKNPLIKAVTMFQVEQLNQYQYALMDIPRQNRDKAAGAVAAALFQMILGSFLYNELSENVTGRRAAADPANIAWEAINDFKGRKRSNLLKVLLADEDLYSPQEIKASQARANLAKNIRDQIPIINFMTGGRVPIADIKPDFGVINDNADAYFDSPKARSKVNAELLKPAAYLGSPVGYGVQARKTIEGLTEMAEGGDFNYDKEGNKLMRYPVDNSSPLAWIKNGAFGRTASEGYREWKRNGYKSLTAKQTAAYKQIVQNGNMSYDQFMSAVYATKDGKKAEKARALYDMEGLSAKQKQEFWATLGYSDKEGYVPDFKQNKKDFYKKWEVTAE